jgi:acetyl-CoA C-acetyltransferase
LTATGSPDPARTPVVVAAGQVTEKERPVDVLELAAAAANAALDTVTGLRGAIDRVSVVSTLSPAGPALAAALARRAGVQPSLCEMTVTGGNTPQALVNRAATDITAGRLRATLIAGAEALNTGSARPDPPEETLGAPDPVHGTERLGVGQAETNAGLFAPVHIYAMLESAIAARAGRRPAEHRMHLGSLLAPFTEVAALHPCAWFGTPLAAEQIATPGPDNRLVAEPYTKRMCAFLGVAQAAALVVCSLEAARAAGVADRAVFVLSGASCNDVWEPVARPRLGLSPAIGAAAGAALSAGGHGLDEVSVIDLYSCFPSALQAALSALGLSGDDKRGLTVTGGLPYFGGPGNNYSTHAIATLTDRLREDGQGVGLVGALGWYVTKHSYGLYGTEPSDSGYREGDTSNAQAEIDATALEVVDDAAGLAGTIAAATVAYHRDAPLAAPAYITLDDGRRAVANATDPAGLGGEALVGCRVELRPGRRYEISG